MGKVVAFQDRPLPQRQAMARIKLLWESGSYDWGVKHAEERLLQRGLSNLDVEHLVRFGHVSDFSKPGHHWRYRVDGFAVDGDRIAAIFELRKEEMTVVTIFT